jgi:predicted enzyme related to lactoylglutathione lyase
MELWCASEGPWRRMNSRSCAPNLAVEDIQQAVKKAEEHGATVAYPPTRQGQPGTFAIVIVFV